MAGGTYGVVGGTWAAVGGPSSAGADPAGAACQLSLGYWAGHSDSFSANGASRRRDPSATCLAERDSFSLSARIANLLPVLSPDLAG